jgi:molybdenum cofactor cytidylyltransferase
VNPRPVVGLFLAAGRGMRFAAAAGDPHANKLCARLPDGRRVIAAALDAFLAHVDECVAVVEHADSAALAHLRRGFVRTIIAPDAALGMSHSLAAAAREAQYRFPTLGGAVVALADMPLIASDTIARVVQAVRVSDDSAPLITRPRVRDKPGHPVGFSKAMLPAIADLQGDEGARTLMRARADVMRWIEVDDAYCAFDIDLPSDIGKTLANPRA